MTTKQQLYTKVRDHLLSQNERCAVNGKCRYRYSDLKCAIGALIEDEHYCEGLLEGADVTRPRVLEAVAKSQNITICGEISELLHSLQYVHDEIEVFNWVQELNSIAVRYGLSGGDND